VQVVVGRIGRAHGVRGEVSVEVRTDDPDQRFAPGTVLGTESGATSLTVSGSHWHSGRLLLSFAGVTDRNAAEQLRGTVLTADVDPTQLPDDPDSWFDHQLVGLTAMLRGEPVGTVSAVVHLPGQDLLEISGPDPSVLVPFIAAFVPEVDLAVGQVVLTPPPGLFEAAEEGSP
jgi:16S rRNA processing protein RimM